MRINSINNTTNNNYRIPIKKNSRLTFSSRLETDRFENNKSVNEAKPKKSLLTLVKNFFIPKNIRSKKYYLPEHIDFQKADNMAQAQKFAQENFGIKTYDVEDLDVANYVNEGFCLAINKTGGQIIIPQKILSFKCKQDFQQALFHKTLLINSNVMSDEKFVAFAAGDHNFYDREFTIPSDFLSKINLLNLFLEHGGCIPRSKFHDLFHEIGHVNHEVQHLNLYSKYSDAGSGYCAVEEDKLSPMAEKHYLLCQKKLKDKERLLGGYALIYPNEYVAEMYAYLMSGVKLPKEFFDIYKKYGGPDIPNII